MKKIDPSPVPDAKSEICYAERNGMMTVGLKHALSVLAGLERIEKGVEFERRGAETQLRDAEAMKATALRMCRELLKYVPESLAPEEAEMIKAIRMYVGE